MLYFADNFIVDENSKVVPAKSYETTAELLKLFMSVEGWRSYICNEKAAKLLSKVLETHIKVNKTPLELNDIDPNNDSLVLFKINKIGNTMLIRFFVILFEKSKL